MEISITLEYSDNEIEAIRQRWHTDSGEPPTREEIERIIAQRFQVLKSNLEDDLEWHLNNPNGWLRFET